MRDEQPERSELDRIDTTVPHSARVWNYWLGGKDNYEVDRTAGDQFYETFPSIVDIARHSRHLLKRVVRHMAGEEGIRQFLDIGTGLPTLDNTHQVAQRMAPEARIVYVDNDPLVLAHARALLTSTHEGVTAYVDADLLEPDKVIAAAAETLDFRRPVGLMLMGILGHISDEDDPHAIVGSLLEPLPSGSFLSLWDGVNVVTGEALDEAQEDYNEGGGVPYNLRGPEEITRFFDGLELLEPGVVSVTKWRPESTPWETPAEVDALCGVARKP